MVKQQYFQLSRKFHPDFIANGTSEEQHNSLELSADINKAYKIFNNQDLTIKYILELKKILHQEEKYTLPNSFLLEMMQLNEEVMDAKMEENQSVINHCKTQIIKHQTIIKQEIENIITATNIDDTTENDLQKVKEYYFKKKYLNRILESKN